MNVTRIKIPFFESSYANKINFKPLRCKKARKGRHSDPLALNRNNTLERLHFAQYTNKMVQV